MLVVGLLIRLDSRGPAIFWSERFGQHGILFKMPKFRTMRIDTPQLPTHLLTNGQSHLTRIGGFLRRSSIDELPQLYSVLKGDMSLVGPRPALFNQQDLMALRASVGVDTLKPGVTGWAQINGRDELDLESKVAFETEYFKRRSTLFDFKIVLLTAVKMFRSEGVSH